MNRISFIACVLLIILCSCNSSKQASKKRRKQAPCDCPKFNYVPPSDNVYYLFASHQMIDAKDIVHEG